MTVTYGTTVSAINAQTAELLKGYWEQIGVSTNIIQVPQDQFITKALFGDPEFFMYGWRNHAGVKIDSVALAAQSQRLEKDLATYNARIFELAGEPFNIASPQQLSRILFEKLQLPGGRKGKTGKVVRVEAISDSVTEERIALVSFDELWRTSDVVSLHAPSLPSTHHVVNATTLAMIKPGSYLVNCARGALVDQDALVAALDSGNQFWSLTAQRLIVDNKMTDAAPALKKRVRSGGGTRQGATMLRSPGDRKSVV